MALGTFDTVGATTNSFSDWLTKTNQMIDLFRENAVTANSSGGTTDGDAILNGTWVANTIVAADEIRGGDLSTNGALTISTNATCSANLTVSGTLSVGSGNLSYTIDSSNYTDLIPGANGDLLGNTTKRWTGSFDDVDVSGNVDVTSTLTVDTLVVSTTATLPGALSFTGNTSFENIDVSGVASFGNLEVSSLVTNTAALIGTSGSVNSTANTVIDQFDKTVSRGFKYIIHGSNDEANSAYAIEINCSHNGSNVFFTRFGEVSNDFTAVLTPQISGANVQLVANCSSASGSNVHSFNIVRIETR